MFGHPRIACLLAVLLLARIAVAQMGYSADIVDLQKPGTPKVARIYVTDEKKRIEMLPGSGADSIIVNLTPPTDKKKQVHLQAGGEGEILILDSGAHSSTILRPELKTHSKAPHLVPAPPYGLYLFIHPTDADNACEEFMVKPAAEGETCKKVGQEPVHGRDTVKYDLSCYGEVCHLWIDRNLHVLVKRETKWNSTELQNIEQSMQPDSLFQIPVGYQETKLTGSIRATGPQ